MSKSNQLVPVFITHNDCKHTKDCNGNYNQINSDGTHLQGEIHTTYAQLKTMFGQPTDGDGYKVDAEWQIKFADGTVAIIHNWKNGKNYNGKDGLPKTKITDWYIGGHDNKAVTKLEELLKC